MTQFKDNRGRSWAIHLNVQAALAVRDRFGVNLFTAVQPGSEAMAALARDPILVVEIITFLCESQLQAKGVTREDFYAAMDGDVLGDLADALIRELVFFSSGPKAVKEALLKKTEEVRETLKQRAEQEIRRVDPQAIVSWRQSDSRN